jgi:UDP-N-acetylmuramyl pentapeptide phosphotransferase/UDP-N-acetylglucosamine-1-phosphate transferase
MQSQMNDALNGLAMMAGFIAIVGLGAAAFVTRQAHKYAALAEAERQAQPHADS